MTEPQYQCPKCQNNFPASQIHNHFTDCKGVAPQAPPSIQYPTTQPSMYPQTNLNPQQYQPVMPMSPQYANPQYYTSQPPTMYVPQHQHHLVENDSFKWCADPACPDKHRYLRLKLRGTWFLFVRYGLKLFWIQFLISVVLALGLVSAFHIGR